MSLLRMRMSFCPRLPSLKKMGLSQIQIDVCSEFVLRTHRVDLFDGLSAFIPGTDDTLRNMRWRMDEVCAQHPLGVVVQEIFDRLQREGHDNVYLRFRQRHTRDKTSWW